MVRRQRSANFIHLNGATSLRLVLSAMVTLMSLEICEEAADSNLWTGDGEDHLEEY